MSFDRLAPHYGWLEPLLAGRVLQRARAAWLPQLSGRRRVLVLGDGPGQALELALHILPDAEFTYVDASRAMLEIARRRIAAAAGPERADRVMWVQAELPGWLPAADAGFDAVITSCFLDCFPPAELTDVITGVAHACTADAAWIVVDFALPARGWRRWRARFAHGLMYPFFRIATGIHARRLTDPAADLRAAGFARKSRREYQFGLVVADYWERVRVASALKAPRPTMEMCP